MPTTNSRFLGRREPGRTLDVLARLVLLVGFCAALGIASSSVPAFRQMFADMEATELPRHTKFVLGYPWLLPLVSLVPAPFMIALRSRPIPVRGHWVLFVGTLAFELAWLVFAAAALYGPVFDLAGSVRGR